MTNLDEVRRQIECGVLPIEDGKITKLIKMSPELQKSMKKILAKYQKSSEEILKSILGSNGH